MQTTATFAVADMTCQNCVKHVGEAIAQAAPGATYAVDLAAGTATVTFDPDATSTTAIIAALEEDGYPTRLFTQS